MTDKNKNKNLDEELLNRSLDDELEIKETIDEPDDINGASEEYGEIKPIDKEDRDKFSYVKLRLLKIQEDVKQILKYLDKEAVEENFTIEPALQEKLELIPSPPPLLLLL